MKKLYVMIGLVLIVSVSSASAYEDDPYYVDRYDQPANQFEGLVIPEDPEPQTLRSSPRSQALEDRARYPMDLEDRAQYPMELEDRAGYPMDLENRGGSEHRGGL